MLPLVPSTTVPPSLSAPHASAASSMLCAILSFAVPPGFMNSALHRMRLFSSLESCRSSTMGVPPTSAS